MKGCVYSCIPAFLINCFFVSSAAAQFVTVDVIPFPASSIAASDYVFVGQANGPTVRAYDIATGVFVHEITLLAAATQGAPTGVLSLAVGSDGSIIVGTQPHGEVFRIQALGAISLGTLPNFGGGDSYSAVTAIALHRGNLYFGGRPRTDTSTVAFRTTSGNSLVGATVITLDTQTRRVRDIDGFDSIVAIGTEDTPVGSVGRLFHYNTITRDSFRVFAGDSAVTAVAESDTTLLFATAPSGRIRNAFSLADVATVPETQVNTMLYALNGPDSATFVGSETNVLRIITRAGALVTLGTPNVAMRRILDLAFTPSPERTYGIGTDNAGASYLFFYETVPPRIESIRFSIDTPLRQPSTPEAFAPPLTRGNYEVRIRASEQLRAPPVMTLTYSDGETQIVVLRTSDSVHFTGEFTIDSSRAAGPVLIGIVAIDIAGNTGTVIVPTSVFENRDIGHAVIANNFFKPNQGEFMTVRYLLFSPQIVTVRIYNMRGQLVSDISPGFRNPGEYQDAVWRGRTINGALAASGVYFVRFEAGGFRKTMKTMMVR